MDAERRLIAKLARTGSVEKAINQGVTPGLFEDEQCAEVWQHMTAHARRWNAPPSFEVIRHAHPDFAFEIVTDSLDFVLHEFMNHATVRACQAQMLSLAELMDDDDQIENLPAHFMEAARKVAMIAPSSAVSRFSDMDRRMYDYYERMFGRAPKKGIPWGVRFVDNNTFGIQPHDFVTITGWSGTGKSTLSQHTLFHAYMSGVTPMLVSMEMEAEAMLRRFDVMATKVDYKRMKGLDLTPDEIQVWEQAAVHARQAANDIIILDDIYSCTIDRIFAEMTKWQPGLVCIDYITLMQVPQGDRKQHWQQVTEITNGLKRISRTLKIPILGVAQSNIDSAEGGARASNVAYSRSILQDSDVMIGLHQSDEMRKNKRMTVRLLKNRDGAPGEADMWWNPDKMEFRDWRPGDMWAQKDAEPQEVEA